MTKSFRIRQGEKRLEEKNWGVNISGKIEATNVRNTIFLSIINRKKTTLRHIVKNYPKPSAKRKILKSVKLNIPPLKKQQKEWKLISLKKQQKNTIWLKDRETFFQGRQTNG